SVDNIPGVPGIGQKTAAQLLEEYGDLDTLLERASEIKQNKRRETLIEHREKALMSRELVRLKDDVPNVEPLDAFTLQPPNGPKLIAFLKAVEFTTLTRRVAEASDTDAAEIEPMHVDVEWGAAAHGPDLEASPAADPEAASSGDIAPTPDSRGAGDTPADLASARAAEAIAGRIDIGAYSCIRDLPTLEAWIAEAREAGVVAFDTETTSLDPMQGELCG